MLIGVMMSLRNPLALLFRDSCLDWYRHRAGHNYRGRQEVTIILAKRYSALRMARHLHRFMPILDEIENAIRQEHDLKPVRSQIL